MEGPVTERDWKYLRSIHDEMLHALCMRINEKAAAIASDGTGNPHERYLRLYRPIKKSDAVVAECFDDWRRSRVGAIILSLRRHRLLQDAHIRNFGGPAREWLVRIEEMEKK